MYNILFSFSEFNEKANELFEPLHDFIVKNHSNPVFWICAFGLGLGVFFMSYGALHGNSD